ncbi:peptide deformylase [Bacillus marinisedimentorum]|uniref:peptide deformylase n=1 Tax=Bacillus marinisedimentorum TaxID=1821260 RepID=UPI0007DF7AAC|nr:peptide deformylase [Bacillus marinisedimentorum]
MITMKDIIKEGEPVLRETADEVGMPPSAGEQETLSDMLQFLKNSQDPEMASKYNLRPGVGLAAPQINIPKRMIAVHVTDEKDRLYSYALFNPKISSHSVEQSYLSGGEGCLSVDRDVPGIVPRYARITVQGTDVEGNKVKLRLRGLPSIVFQHEIDHLNGIMFYDHIDQENPFDPPAGAKEINR